MDFSLFIARRLFRGRGGYRKVSRPAITIATSGVAVGLAVMVVSVCVVMGFKHEISSKVTGFGSHVQVLNYASATTNSPQPVAVPLSLVKEVEGMDGVAHVQRFCNKEGILKTDADFKGILLHGVGEDFDASFMKDNMEEGVFPSFSDTAASNRIVISRRVADGLHLKVGSKVFAYFFENTVRTRRFTVCGIYCTHLTEFDDVMVFTDLYTCKHLNAWDTDRYSGMEIAVEEPGRTEEVAGALAKRLNRETDAYGGSYVAMTIRELYPQMFAWLDLLNVNVWVILALMVSVAGFTMVSGLLIIILERTNFIGIMKALGASDRGIRHVFLYFAVFVLGRGMLWGNLIGTGMVTLQRYTGLFRLDASVYYVDAVPVLFNAWYVLGINAATLSVCVLSLVVPSFLVSRISPSKSIRFD